MSELMFELPAQQRFQALLDSAKAHKGVWSLGDDEGLAASETAEGVTCFSLWPSAELAKACALGDWLDNQPTWIGLDDLTREWLPQLGELGLMISVFPSPGGEGLEMQASELLAALS